MRSSRKGFTLIELLVVIAIIAILAAILFPVFARARDKARQAACQTHMKELALAVIQYASDYDDTNLPLSYRPDGTEADSDTIPFGGPGVNNVMLLDPYVKNNQMWGCPADPFIPSGDFPKTYAFNLFVFADMRPAGLGSGYDVGGRVLWSMRGDTSLTNSRVTMPANLIMCGERWPMASTRRCGRTNYSTTAPTQWRNNSDHGGPYAGNYAFMDGHIKWHRYGTTINPNLWTPQ